MYSSTVLVFFCCTKMSAYSPLAFNRRPMTVSPCYICSHIVSDDVGLSGNAVSCFSLKPKVIRLFDVVVCSTYAHVSITCNVTLCGQISVSFVELSQRKIKIPTEMSQNLMILHSYVIARVSTLSPTRILLLADKHKETGCQQIAL